MQMPTSKANTGIYELTDKTKFTKLAPGFLATKANKSP